MLILVSVNFDDVNGLHKIPAMCTPMSITIRQKGLYKDYTGIIRQTGHYCYLQNWRWT